MLLNATRIRTQRWLLVHGYGTRRSPGRGREPDPGYQTADRYSANDPLEKIWKVPSDGSSTWSYAVYGSTQLPATRYRYAARTGTSSGRPLFPDVFSTVSRNYIAHALKRGLIKFTNMEDVHVCPAH